jgi:heme/copper-type cytochrome/quinol oxidase subunit 2
MKNKTLWILFTVMTQLFSWGIPVAFVAIEYGAFIMSNSIVIVFALAIGLALWVILKYLKDAAENGYGLYAKVARSIRFVMPLTIITSLVVIVNTGLGAFVPLILVFLIGNILAQPMSVLGYYYGPSYIRDTGINKLVNKK